MSNYKRGHKYWSIKQEQLCLQWVSATTQSEFTRIHNALLPQLNHMCELIMQRYFSIPASQHTDLKRDTVQEVFLKLKKYQPNRGAAGSYSFCSMIIKHYLHERVVIYGQRLKVTELEFSGDYDLLDTAKGIEYYQKPEIDFKPIIDYFIQKKEKTIKRYNNAAKNWEKKQNKTNYDKHNFKRTNEKLMKWIIICDLSVEFINKFQSADANQIAEYCFLNSDYKLSTVVNAFEHMFKLNVTIRDDNRESADEKKGLNMYNDDYTGEVNIWHKRQYNKKRMDNNKISNDYSYF